MKTNGQAVNGTIHPATFPVTRCSPVAGRFKLEPVYMEVTLLRGLCATLKHGLFIQRCKTLLLGYVNYMRKFSVWSHCRIQEPF